MAVHANPSKIYAVEIIGCPWLPLENVEINQVQDVVEPILGNCREVAPRNIADRGFNGIYW
jgi:tRNA wybutosine-synthesizing protein 2